MSEENEIEVHIEPIEEVLQKLRISANEFDSSLAKTLELCEVQDVETAKSIYEMAIVLKGITFQLDEVATIRISGDEELLREIEEDEAG